MDSSARQPHLERLQREVGQNGFPAEAGSEERAGRLHSYRNGLYLNRELAQRDDWTENAIHARTDMLANEVNAIFALDSQCIQLGIYGSQR